MRRAFRRPRQSKAALLVCGSSVMLLAGCNAPRTLTQLAADAAEVPVPPGVIFVRAGQTINDGPGFTSSKFEEAGSFYSSNAPCASLERDLVDVLRAAGRQFQVSNNPHKYGSVGSLEINITDRPENLVINIGFDDGRCGSPLVSAFNSPH